jgi:lipopolysaccharide/colanic/teichoic acid biosynthesis glycosyltransferase
MKSPVPSSTFMKNILETFRFVAKDLLEKPDADKDNMERLSTVGRNMRYLSMEELRSLWEQIKGMDEIYL